MRKWSKLKTRQQKWRRIKDMAGKYWRKLKKPFSTAWYWLRTHTINRYHIVNCKSPQNDYDWGWCDRDYLMLCACFNILVAFVEKESPNIGLGDPMDPENYGGWSPGEWEQEIIKGQWARDQEIRALYNWWKTERSKEHKLADHLLHKVPKGKADPNESNTWNKMCQEMGMDTPEWKTWTEAREALDKKDNDMLDRLMKIRESLWT